MISPPDSEPPRRQARPSEVASAVLWSFFGVRKRKKMRDDAVSIRPHQVIIVGDVFAVSFVLGLLLILRLVIRLAGA